MKNPSASLICVTVRYAHMVCLWLIPLCSSSRLCCIFFTYKEDISVLRTSSVCKSVKSLTSCTGQSLSFKSWLPKKRRGPHLGKLIFLVASTGLDTGKRHFVYSVLLVEILYLLGKEKKQWLPLLSTGGANFVQGDGGMSCQGHLVYTDPMLSMDGANALGNW